MDDDLRRFVGDYLEPNEVVRAVMNVYTYTGAGRRVVCLTNRRIVVVKRGYMALKDKGLDWSDDIEAVAISHRTQTLSVNGIDTGRLEVEIRRASGRIVIFNLQKGIGPDPSASERSELLFSLIPGRFNL
jgi:hypothetical protein